MTSRAPTRPRFGPSPPHAPDPLARSARTGSACLSVRIARSGRATGDRAGRRGPRLISGGSVPTGPIFADFAGYPPHPEDRMPPPAWTDRPTPEDRPPHPENRPPHPGGPTAPPPLIRFCPQGSGAGCSQEPKRTPGAAAAFRYISIHLKINPCLRCRAPYILGPPLGIGGGPPDCSRSGPPPDRGGLVCGRGEGGAQEGCRSAAKHTCDRRSGLDLHGREKRGE